MVNHYKKIKRRKINNKKFPIKHTHHISNRKRCRQCFGNLFIERTFEDYVLSRDALINLMFGVKLDCVKFYDPCNSVCLKFDTHNTAKKRLFDNAVSHKYYHEDIFLKITMCNKCNYRVGVFTLKKKNSIGNFLKGKKSPVRYK